MASHHPKLWGDVVSQVPVFGGKYVLCADAFCGAMKAVRAMMAIQAAEKQGVVFMGKGDCMDWNPGIRRAERLKVYFDMRIFPGLMQRALAPKRILLFSLR